MSRDATAANKDANSQYTGWEQSSLNGYNSDINNYSSNVNAAIAAGDPYKSQQYLQSQNLETSAAMDSANTAEKQQLRDTAARTGTNSAAVAATVASSARAGQRDVTQYNASRDTANQDKYLTYEQQLMQDQLGAANSQAGMFGTQVGGRSSALGNLTSIQNSQDQMWGDITGKAIGAAGAVGAAAAG